jgi:hypothetical protein
MLLLLLLIKIQPINQNLGIQMEHIGSISEQAAESDKRASYSSTDRSNTCLLFFVHWELDEEDEACLLPSPGAS